MSLSALPHARRTDQLYSDLPIDDDDDATAATTARRNPPSSSSAATTTGPGGNGVAFVVKHRSNIPSLVAALSASMVTGGTTYAFGLYGNDLKRSLSLSSAELDTISTAFFFAGLFSWIPGLSADRFGTKFSIATGGITGAVALHTYWAVATKSIDVDRQLLVPVLSLLGISIFLSCAMITGSVFKIIVSCCGPGTKGSAVGVAKGLVGLGSGFYTCIFGSLRTHNETSLDFLRLAAVLSVVAATLPALLLLPSKAQADRDVMVDDATPRHFRVLFLSLFMMACMIVWDSLDNLSQRHASSDSDGNGAGALQTRHIPLAVLFLSIWLLPIASLLLLPRRRRGTQQRRSRTSRRSTAGIGGNEAIDGEDDHDSEEAPATGMGTSQRGNAASSAAGWYGRHGSDTSRGNVSMTQVTTQLPLGDDRAGEEEEDDDDASNEGRVLLSLDHFAGLPRRASTSPVPSGGEDGDSNENNKNLIQLLRTPSAWLMLWTTTLLVGAGTLETNSMGEMVEALGFPSAVTASSLALFSVAQAVSRVLTGAVSESALNWNTKRFWIDVGIPRPFFLVLASILAALSHFVLALATKERFFVIGSALSGAAFGMVWPLMVLIVGEVFGVPNAGANYMFYDGFSSAVGTLLITKGLAQHVYDHYADHADVKSGGVCQGLKCFQLTQLLVAAASVSCVATSLGLAYTSRRAYNTQGVHHA